jgi:hypothetical protein
MIDSILARKAKRPQGSGLLSETVAEGECNVGAVGTPGAGLGVAELMEAAGLDKVERKRLARVAKGSEVCP